MLDWLSDLLFRVALPALATGAAGLVVAVLQRQFKKLGIEITEDQQAAIRRIVRDAILAVEELARREPEMTSAEKVTAAEVLIVEKRPDLSPEKVRELIDAELPKARAAGYALPRPRTPADLGRR